SRSSGSRARPRRSLGRSRARTRAPRPRCAAVRPRDTKEAWSSPSDRPPRARSPPLPEELADRLDDRVAIADLAHDHLLFVREVLLEVLEELARPVGAVHLPVAEGVGHGEDPVAQDLHAEI